ncbi:MAG: hypothetical protein KAT68_12675 [Bacteroidales bacterium]|nr:hypothetical protein [Bacteroidales bacterium]
MKTLIVLKKRNLFIPFLFGIFMMSCAPAYIPNIVNTPMLSNEGEIQGSIAIGSSGIDPQIAYAVNDKIGVMINGSFRNDTDIEGTTDYHQHAFLEFGGGYYNKLTKVARFGLYGGYGFGTINSSFSNDILSSKANANSQRLFLQPGIGISTGIFDFGLHSRFSFVNIEVKDNDFKASNSGKFDPYWEPALTIKLGYRYFKFFSQLGFSFPLYSYNTNYSFQFLIFGMGAQLKFGRDYKKK